MLMTTSNLSIIFLPIIAYFIAKTNWPYSAFISLLHVATLKERYFPSPWFEDAPQISAEIRGLSWLLLAGPAPPHDVKQIRRMVDTLWPNVWRGVGLPDGITVQEIPIPVTSGDGGAVIYSSENSGDGDGDANAPRNGVLFGAFKREFVGEHAIVFVHGGGLIAGNVQIEYGIAAEMAKRCNCPVMSVDYRLLPEATIAEATSDVIAAFDWMSSRNVDGRGQISIVGGSAGGILSLLSGIALRDRARRWEKVHGGGDASENMKAPNVPAKLGLLSPGPGLEWLSNPPEVMWPSLESNHLRDGFMAGGFYHFVRHLVFDDAFTRRYFAAAMRDLSGLPPCFVTVGGHEVLLDGVRILANRLEEAKVNVTMKEYDQMPHVHHALYFWARESSEALDNIVSWLMDSSVKVKKVN
jgi:acetyl esterase/lipase